MHTIQDRLNFTFDTKTFSFFFIKCHKWSKIEKNNDFKIFEGNFVIADLNSSTNNVLKSYKKKVCYISNLLFCRPVLTTPFEKVIVIYIRYTYNLIHLY